MTAPHADELIDGYLARLRVAAMDLSPSVREELIEDMRAHIAEARAHEPEETDATILNILDRLGDPELLAAEARLCGLLHHPGIVQVHELGEVDGEYYLAMELVDGPDLRSILRRSKLAGSRLSAGLVCHIVSELASALVAEFPAGPAGLPPQAG